MAITKDSLTALSNYSSLPEREQYSRGVEILSGSNEHGARSSTSPTRVSAGVEKEGGLLYLLLRAARPQEMLVSAVECSTALVQNVYVIQLGSDLKSIAAAETSS
jgi:hypothetical protein